MLFLTCFLVKGFWLVLFCFQLGDLDVSVKHESGKNDAVVKFGICSFLKILNPGLRVKKFRCGLKVDSSTSSTPFHKDAKCL